ncbi:MAG: hypothetical protein ACREOS_07440 [Candidatus Dormibacteraceae bacterium]
MRPFERKSAAPTLKEAMVGGQAAMRHWVSGTRKHADRFGRDTMARVAAMGNEVSERVGSRDTSRLAQLADRKTRQAGKRVREPLVVVYPTRRRIGWLRAGLVLIGAGAAAAYMLDPELGRARRQTLAERARRLAHEVDGRARQLKGRVEQATSTEQRRTPTDRARGLAHEVDAGAQQLQASVDQALPTTERKGAGGERIRSGPDLGR